MKYVMSSILILSLWSCSSHPTQSEVMAPATQKSPNAGVGIEANQVAAEQSAEFVTELNFNKKEQALSKANKAKLNYILGEALKKGKVSNVKIMSWADAEYPSVHTKKLSADERKLADERNNSIKSFFTEQVGDAKIDAYSMAERANALKEFVGSSEARVKKSLEMAGIPTTDTTVKYPSKASKSIVLIIME